MVSTAKIVVWDVEEFVQAVLAAPSGKCRIRMSDRNDVDSAFKFVSQGRGVVWAELTAPFGKCRFKVINSLSEERYIYELGEN